MKRFSFIVAKSIDEAAEVLRVGNAAVIAGGTDLLNILKARSWPDPPPVIVSIKGIPELNRIDEDERGLKIGSAVRLGDLEKSQIIQEAYPLLSKAAHAVGSPQIRNMGTIGGNICQDTRCWYYRYPGNVFNCMRKGGKTCYAVSGDSRYHSIFGGYRVSDPPCRTLCPGHISIPSILSKLRDGKGEEAARTLLERNPFPAVTGRVCPHFCQDECNRREMDDAVSIRNIERFLGDYVLEHAEALMKAPETSVDQEIAIVGSGPAGLSAAYYLRGLGYRVTVFEGMEKPGGMLTYAIPAYRLPKRIVAQLIQTLENMGVKFRTEAAVGKDITLESLRNHFAGVLLATGAWAESCIGLKGESSTRTGLGFLQDVLRGTLDSVGRSVVVVGGGNVAVDVAITAKRLGAPDVTLLCMEKREEMPAFAWEIRQALEEGVRIMNSWGPSRVLEKGGLVEGLEIIRCESVFDAQGNFSPVCDESQKKTLKADEIVVAAGQKADLSCIPPELSLKTERGLVMVEAGSQRSSVAGIFAGGDVTTGQGSVIQAIASGRAAAFGMDRYLMPEKYTKEKTQDGKREPFLTFHPDCLKHTRAVPLPVRPVHERNLDAEDTMGPDGAEIQREVNRCFNCGCVAVSPSDMAPALIALDASIETTKRTVAAAEFFTVQITKSTVLDPDEQVLRLKIPKPSRGSRQVFLKYSPRRAIDFPIVSVAVVLVLNAERVSRARIAMSGVAPVPLRMEAAEDRIRGREINEQNAEAAADAVAMMTLPFPQNRFMVQIARTLIKRGILACREGRFDSGCAPLHESRSEKTRHRTSWSGPGGED